MNEIPLPKKATITNPHILLRAARPQPKPPIPFLFVSLLLLVFAWQRNTNRVYHTVVEQKCITSRKQLPGPFPLSDRGNGPAPYAVPIEPYLSPLHIFKVLPPPPRRLVSCVVFTRFARHCFLSLILLFRSVLWYLSHPGVFFLQPKITTKNI
eukprot:TRINITY_DN5931_c0_g1_i1.p2 TRINITY_DN5931_c0_g1~~TRINITY_DN5931_c0_g1_i1.p2  ORF type:complete len:153 (-),score=4.43 TRINITY_DN5931_c0_g1_i1:223-681(-)